MNTPYRHIFFDLDHTLWDFDRASASVWQGLYEGYDLAGKGAPDFDTFLAAYIAQNEKYWERFRKGWITRDELRRKRIWQTFLQFGIYDSALADKLSEVYLERLPLQTHLMPYAKDILQYCLDKGYTLHLVTNGFEIGQRQKIKNSGIAHFFKEVITSERSNSMKPHREIWDFCLRETGAACDGCLMIGDALEVDVIGAMDAGWHGVYYNPARKPHDRKPTYEITCLSELKEII